MSAIIQLVDEYIVQSIEVNYGKNIYCLLKQMVSKENEKVTNFVFFHRCQGRKTILQYIPDTSKLYFPSEYYLAVDNDHFKDWRVEDFQKFDEFHHLYSIDNTVVKNYLGEIIPTPVVLGSVRCMNELGLVGNLEDVSSILSRHSIPILSYEQDFSNHIQFSGAICASLEHIPYYNRDYEEADYTVHITLRPPLEYVRSSKDSCFKVLQDLYPEFVKECKGWRQSLRSNPTYTDD